MSPRQPPKAVMPLPRLLPRLLPLPLLLLLLSLLASPVSANTEKTIFVAPVSRPVLANADVPDPATLALPRLDDPYVAARVAGLMPEPLGPETGGDQGHYRDRVLRDEDNGGQTSVRMLPNWLRTVVPVSAGDGDGNAVAGTDSWFLLANLVPGRRYEVRVCWLATVRCLSCARACPSLSVHRTDLSPHTATNRLFP